MAGRTGFTSRRKSDGKPRKLRKATHPRARRHQARRIKEASLKRKLRTSELVHHSRGLGNNKPGTLKVMKGQKRHATRHHPNGALKRTKRAKRVR
jgi:hypothetical protein